MAFDFGAPAKSSTPSTPSTTGGTPSTGAAKPAPAGFHFGTPATGVAAAAVAPRCPNCGATMARLLVSPSHQSHEPLPPEFACPKCGYRTPY